MSNDLETDSSPVLNEETRTFVRCALQSGLIQLPELKKIVASLLIESPEVSPQRLCDGLVGGGLLTQWQANKLLSGKNRGFYLGSYRLLRPLGRGGMGVVYLGEHDVMRRLMALKILPPEASVDPRRIERFKQEARAAAQLDHPNIVRAYDFADSGGKLFIAMEYVDGIDLHQAVLRDGKLSVHAALDVLHQTAQGLTHAHDRGIVHRDIKPSNLLLRTDGVVKISDMGLARVGWIDDAAGENNRVLGSVDFMAPEQAINSASVDTRADIYSLGCTLFYLLTGQAPFSGDSPEQKLAKHQTNAAPDVRKTCPDCPANVADMLMRMMAKRPDDRPQSAGDLLSWIKQLNLASSTDTRNGSQAGSLANQSLQSIAPATDTLFDSQMHHKTIDDSSLLPGDSGSHLGHPIAPEWDDLDWGVVPATNHDSPPAVPSPATAPTPLNANPNQPVSKKTTLTNKLLPIAGLAAASVALIVVLSMLAYSMLGPSDPQLPKFQDVSDGNGGHMIIVHQ